MWSKVLDKEAVTLYRNWDIWVGAVFLDDYISN
jgi:hypothetical protein